MKIHMVKQGDTLYAIAKKYNVPLEELIKANPEISNPDELAIGTKVKIHTQPKSAIEVMHQHIVQQGDTLWKLSKAWGVHLSDMIKANPQLKNPNALLTGEVVNIPKAGTANQAGADAGVQGNMQGKAPTGVKPGTGMKPDTGTMPETAPMPLPTPMPAPNIPAKAETAPMPLPMPIPMPQPAPNIPAAPVLPVQQIQPIYGTEKAHDLFMQYPTPAVKAGAEADCPPDYGYGSGGLPNAVSPAAQQPGGYGYAPMAGIGPLGGHLGHLGGHIHGGLGGLPGDYGGYGPNTAAVHNAAFPGAVSPAATGGCSSCGSPSGLTLGANLFPGAGNPSAVQPWAASLEGYGYGLSPQVGGAQAGGMPNAGYPGYYGSYPNAQAADALSPSSSTGHGYSYAGSEPYTYSGYPPIPSFPSLGSMTQPSYNDNAYREPSEQNGEEDGQPEPQAKPRAPKAKPKQAAAKKRQPRRKESLPWINW